MKNALIVDNYTTKLSIKGLKQLIGETDYEIKKILDLSNYEFENYDMIILSGGRVNAEHCIFDNIKDQIKNSGNKKIIGICLGYQILGLAYDTSGEYIKLHKMENELSGIYDNTFYKKTDGQIQNIKAHRLHSRILKIIKPGLFDVLGHSIYGDDIIKHNIYPHIGFSFHPHIYIDKTDGKYIFDTVCDYGND